MNELGKISVKEELKLGLEHLANKIVYAYNTMLMLRQIHDSCLDNPEYQKVLDATPVFWTLVDYNIANHLLVDAANIFDKSQRDDVFSIPWLIQTSAGNKDVFPQFRVNEVMNLVTHKKVKRRNDIYVDELIKQAEEKYYSVQDIVERVKFPRNKKIAHSDKALIIKKVELSTIVSLQWADIEKLLETAMEIVNIVSYMLCDLQYGLKLGNHDRDAEALLRYAALGLKTEEQNKMEILRSMRGTTL